MLFLELIDLFLIVAARRNEILYVLRPKEQEDISSHQLLYERQRILDQILSNICQKLLTKMCKDRFRYGLS